MASETKTNATLDIFIPRTSADRWHPQFRSLLQSPFHKHARTLINSLFLEMGRIDKNFVEDFQTAGFHTRLFEIGCYAYLRSAEFQFDRSHNRPDFVVSRDGLNLIAEATSANPPGGRQTDIAIIQMPEISQEEISRKVMQELPKRIMSALSRKLAKKYHELPHCEGRPLVLMIAPFFEPGAHLYTDDAVVPCLYPVGREELPNDVPPPFFEMPGAEHVSAVLYINSFSVSRFFRMSTFCGSDAELGGRCWGVHCVDSGAEGMTYLEYQYDLGKGAPDEPWFQGVTIYFNPAAAIPVPRDVLPCSSSFTMQGDVLRRQVFGFHPVTRFMQLWRRQE